MILQKYIPEVPPLEVKSERPTKPKHKKVNKFSPAFNIRQLAFSYLKTDLYQIPGVSHTTILCLLCNMGNDIRPFGSAKQFASWLRLVPNNKKSGGRIISSRTPKGKNAIALCLRQAANSIGNQKDHPLTPFFKRFAYRKGRGAAITATARKLAVIVWNMITKGESYQQIDYQAIDEKRRNLQIRNIKKRLFKLNFTEVEVKKLF